MTGSRFRSGMSRPTRLPLPHPIGKRCEKERSKAAKSMPDGSKLPNMLSDDPPAASRHRYTTEELDEVTAGTEKSIRDTHAWQTMPRLDLFHELPGRIHRRPLPRPFAKTQVFHDGRAISPPLQILEPNPGQNLRPLREPNALSW